MTPDNLILFLSTCFILALIPGQDMLFVIARSLSGGRNTGIIAILGLMLGITFHILLTATGLSAILMTSSTAFTAIKYLGAAYLIYLGMKAWRSKESLSIDHSTLEQKRSHHSSWKTFKEGVLSSTLNPKLALFFLSFLPQFINPNRPAFPQIIVLGVLFMLCALPVLMSAAMLAARFGEKLTQSKKTQPISRWITAVTLVGLGLFLATSEKSS